MSEMKITALFAIAAAVAVGSAWFSRPSAVRSEGELALEKRGSVIFPGLDPDSATSFRIVRFNEDLATVNRLELAKDTKTELWTLPSADGYPADSAEQVSQATTPLVELTVLNTVSTDRGDHVLYGVVEPNEQELTVSASGVGMLVQVGGADNEILASLIVGKPVEGFESQHYVRVPTEDAVYVVEINSDVFSTDLEKWIQGEILNVRSLDIEQVGLRDYAILRTERGYGLGRNFDADVEYKDNKWSLIQFVDHTQEGSPVVDQPPEGKSLNSQVLNDLRSSIQNLQIVNVRRKPLGLAADLKADKSLLENEESTKNLQDQGFFPMESGDVYSAGGELIVGTKDGVKYLLRFGNTRVSGSSMQLGDDEEEEDSDEGVTRYLLVMAELDESKFPVPELKLVPETVEEMLALEAADADTAQEVAQPVDTTGSESEGPEQNEPASPVKDPEAPADDDAVVDSTTEDSTTGEPTADPAVEPEAGDSTDSSDPNSNDTSSGSEDAPSDENSGNTEDTLSSRGSDIENDNVASRYARLVSTQQDDQSGDASAVGTEPQEAAQEASDTTSQESEADREDSDVADSDVAAEEASGESATELAPSRQESPEELQERLEYLQETIQKENQRLIDARNEKLNEGRKKVAELNARFADWYYIVSDRVYNRLKVSREQLFTSGDGAAESPPAPGFELPNLPPGLQLPTE